MGLPSGCGLRFGFAAFGRAHVESAYPDTGASQSSRHPQHIAERAEPLKPGYYQDIELSVPCQLQHAADGCRRTFAIRINPISAVMRHPRSSARLRQQNSSC